MAGRLRGVWPEAMAALVAAVSFVYMTGFAVDRGLSLDDAWIHLVYGRALATTGTLDYNTGTAGTGATSPLWAAFAALAHLVGGDSPFGAAFVLKLFGGAAHVALAWFSARLGRFTAPADFETSAALLAGLTTATCPMLVYAGPSGMEVSIASALVVGAFSATAQKRGLVGGVVAGLAPLARPEAMVCAPIVLVLSLRHLRREQLVRRGLLQAAGVALPSLAWTIRNLVTTGRLLPNTVHAKAFGNGAVERLRTLRTVLVEMLGQCRPLNAQIVFCLALVAIVLALRAIRVAVREGRDAMDDGALVSGGAALGAVAWIAGLSWHTRFLLPEEFYFLRYVLPVVPLLLVGATATLGRALVAVGRQRSSLGSSARVGLAVGLLVAGWNVTGWGRARTTYLDDVHGIDNVNVAVGKFIDDHLPESAVVWSPDAGAVRYLGKRRVVDLVGLNTPTLVEKGVVPDEWSADAVVLIVPFGYRAAARNGLLTVFEAPHYWQTRPNPPDWPGPMPNQTIALCKGAGELVVVRGTAPVARGQCRGRTPFTP